ncbi:MAG: DUF4373 domain-containing protein [Paludibacter sp.]|nr:DUF4373 domain-containing protein [Paludibacter sp.]
MKFNLNSELRNDLKMIACREKHGLRGYGIYINIIALMYEQKNNTLPLDYHLLALEMREDEDIVKSVIIDFKLFRIVKDKNEFFSVEVGNEIERRNELKDKRSHSANQRWHKEKKYQPPTPPVSTDKPTATSSQEAEPELPTQMCAQENDCKDCQTTIDDNRCIINLKETGTFKKIYKPLTEEPAPIAATPPPKLTAEQAKEIVTPSYDDVMPDKKLSNIEKTLLGLNAAAVLSS